jgi:glycosyltransferase involved in cell wall biosynthesis
MATLLEASTMDGVSVVIPCYNCGKYLGAAIESVLGQDYPGPLEILIGDDGSADGSVRVAESFGAAVTVLRHPGGGNRGVSATRNLCVRAARHSLVAFLDGDDLWLPGHLAALAATLAANPGAMLAYDNGYYMTADGKRYGPRHVWDPPHDAESLLVNACVLVCGVLVRKRTFELVGLFDESLRYCEDLDLWLRIAEVFPIVFAPVDGYLYRQHDQQATSAPGLLWSSAKEVVRRAQVRYPYRRAAVRRKNGVLSFRLSQHALRQKRLWRAAVHLGQAAYWDPGRALGELGRRLLGRGTLAGAAR